MAPLFVVDYEELTKIASAFDREADRLRQSFQQVLRTVELLQGGDWFGQGASAFYREMSSEVLPAMKRLPSALEAAGRTTRDIAQNTKDAEDEIVRLFAGLFGLSSAAAIAAVGAGMGPAVGTADGALAGAGLFHGVGVASGAPGVAGPSGAATRQETASALAKIVEDNAVDRKLSMFSSGTRDLVKQSPTLRAQVFQLETNGYVFKTGPVPHYYTDWDHQTIVIDQPRSDADTVAHIAHEVGHGVSTQPHKIPYSPEMTGEQYVQQNVDNLMHNEGEAQFNVAQVRAELKAAGGPNIRIPGKQAADYQTVYDDFAAGRTTQAWAVNHMATLMENERVSKPPHQRYRDYYADWFRKDWDDNYAELAY